MLKGDRTMTAGSRYWHLIQLNGKGESQAHMLETVKAFFERNFEGKELLSDTAIQRSLWSMVHPQTHQNHPDQNHPDQIHSNQEMALWCFRCFISDCVEKCCRQLVAQFGADHGFGLLDLLPYVLDDDGEPWQWESPKNAYSSLAVQVIQSFDPNRASLSTWVARRVRHHPELKQFLLDQGVYMVSDWAILNDTKPTQLQHILGEFHLLSQTEVQNYEVLLQSYHQVYRRDRLHNRLYANTSGGRYCQPPTLSQLNRMTTLLHASTHLGWTPEDIASHLRDLATYLRDYRISVRGGRPQMESMEVFSDSPIKVPSVSSLDLTIPVEDADDNNNAIQEFLTQFRREMLQSLDEALAQVLGDRITSLEKRKKTSPQDFLEGLHLFHCAGTTMGDIATILGLKAQYQVTRLLKLKEFRADVRQRLLVELGDRTHTLAQLTTSPYQLDTLDAQLDDALLEPVDQLMAQAEAEASIARKAPLKSLFAQRLCHYLTSHSLITQRKNP